MLAFFSKMKMKNACFGYAIAVLVFTDFILMGLAHGYQESAVYHHEAPLEVAEMLRRYGTVMFILKLINPLFLILSIGIWLWSSFTHKNKMINHS